MIKPSLTAWDHGAGRPATRMGAVRAGALALAAFAFVLWPSWQGVSATDEPYPVAGVKPDQRPAGAPVITEMTKEAGWYDKALTGVSQPYPYSLRFLEDQGAWFNPFIRPGMTGPYDIRGWHAWSSEGGS